MTNEELLAAINRRFDEVERRFEGNDRRWEANDRRWEANDSRWDEYRRHVDVRFEGVHDEIQRLAEVVALVDEKLERFRSETAENFVDVRERLTLLESRR